MNIKGYDIAPKADLSWADLRGANLSEADLSEADLSWADLRGANLSGADLRRANLSEANLSWANLSEANLSEADLSWADLRRANLSEADLSWANLIEADLRRADLSWADLRGTNLSEADLRRADLSGTKLIGARPNEATAGYWPVFPVGEFVAYKAGNGALIVLRVPAHAERSSATTRKGRVSEAFVEEIVSLYDCTPLHSAIASQHSDFVYEVGTVVKPDAWDPDRWNECSNGIHCFLTMAEALAWAGVFPEEAS